MGVTVITDVDCGCDIEDMIVVADCQLVNRS